MNCRFAHLMTLSLLTLAVQCARGAEQIVHFDIARFDIRGNTLLAPAQVDASVAPFLGKQRDFGDVQRALEALEALYHAHGYKLVQVVLPEQELNSGVVRLMVTPTTIGRVTVAGNSVFDEANIRRSLPALQEGQTPNLAQVSRNLKLANENPAKKLTLKLASASADDEVDAQLLVQDERAWKLLLNVDNSGTAQTGKTHASLVLQHANLWGRDHVASVQYTSTLEKPNQVAVYGAGYHLPLYALGDSVDLFASYSNVDSGTVTAGTFDLAVSGKGANYGARYNHIQAHGADNLDARLIYGFDYKAFKNSVLLAGQDFGNNVTVHPLSLAYMASWTLPEGEANASLTLLRNVPGGSNGGAADFAKARPGAPAGYSVLRFAGAWSRALAQDWQMRLIINGQWSGDALVAGEQFGAGGATSVRGFGERVLSDDTGALANAELYTPNVCVARQPWQCRVLAFVDGAYVSRNAALPGEQTSSAIASAGLGLRLAFGTDASLQIDVGHVLHRGATDGGTRNRVHFRANLSY